MLSQYRWDWDWDVIRYCILWLPVFLFLLLLLLLVSVSLVQNYCVSPWPDVDFTHSLPSYLCVCVRCCPFMNGLDPAIITRGRCRISQEFIFRVHDAETGSSFQGLLLWINPEWNDSVWRCRKPLTNGL
jgi:hypothetical protein